MQLPRIRSALVAIGLLLSLGTIAAASAPAAARPHTGAGLMLTDPSASSAPSGITALWAWGNPIDPAVDARGRGEPQFEPDALADFARGHGLRTVYLSVPWAADEGPFGPWLTAAVTALHGAGVTKVAALGGDPAWADDPTLAATWAAAALRAAPFDAVQFDVEPWAVSSDADLPGVVARLSTMYDTTREAIGATPIGADLPWWLAAKQQPDGGTAFDALLPHLTSVAVVAFSDHAEGPDGIVALAQPAAAAASAAGVPFTVGVETDTPAVAGGASATFGDDTAAALEEQTGLVRAALSSLPGYQGVSVEHLLAWQALIAR
ncbi:hypothetical protein [Leifsonia sp. AG29]|uniref:hypothetical protein n=1 Tax=Leifsonia sp. AG29 TaxID=2598860 RepID=UPI00131AE8D1|nr:hypothetical protein [Leifsonia sp. AG29]